MQGGFSHDIIQMVIHAGLMVKFVMLILFIFSVTSWAIILMKVRHFRRAKAETEEFLDLFRETHDMKSIYRASEELNFSPVARLFRAGFAEFSKIKKIQAQGESSSPESVKGEIKGSHLIMDNLQRSLRKAIVDQASRLESALSFLATTGNTAPFIGLFGTVWGIMQSFRGIGLKGSANLAVVAPGAIPAVVAFNYFNNRVSDFSAEMEIFASDFLSLVERRLFKGQVRG